MRRFLDTLYRVTLWFAALCLVAIALMVGVQMAGRLLDGALAMLGLPRTDFVILSLDEICGYLLAAASFMALAGTLKAGAQIRVTLVLAAFGERVRRFIEIWAFGLVRVPLAYPQAAMAIGTLILTIALLDELAVVIVRGRPSFRVAEDAITVGKEG